MSCVLFRPVIALQERDHYSQFVSEAFDSYVTRKEQDGVHGNNPEMQAACELFNRPIEVYVPEKGSEYRKTDDLRYCRILRFALLSVALFLRAGVPHSRRLTAHCLCPVLFLAL